MIGDLTFRQRIALLRTIDIPPRDIDNLIEDMEGNAINDNQILDSLKLTGPKRNTLLRALEDLEIPLKKALIETWSELIRDESKNKIPPLLCLTGINPEGYSTRVSDTFQTFLKLVGEAKQKITIIGYQFTDGNKNLIEALENRMLSDKIEINVLTDHIKSFEKNNQKFLLKWLKNMDLRFNLYSYEHPDEKEIMHIKCMLVDNDRTYLGSANFSYHGSKKNLELGIVLADEKINNTIESIYQNIIKGDIEYIKRITHLDLKREGII